MTSQVKIVLRNPLNYNDQVDYNISVHDHELGNDWVTALKELLQSGNLLEKNFCFLGFPKTQRTLEFLCSELNQSIQKINEFNATGLWQSNSLQPYMIEEWFHPDIVRFGSEYETGETGNDISLKLGLRPKHDTMNRLHNHFERLQGTVWNLSDYYKIADYETKYAIRQLNNICHEMENLILGQRKLVTAPMWVRPSQITTFLHAKRYDLKDNHRELFPKNGYDRKFGQVYMHWTQIGKTLYEVFRDEDAPKLNIGVDPTDISIGSGTTCEAINSLKFYSGEFDIEWANDVVRGGEHFWHDTEMDRFYAWLDSQGIDPSNPKLSLGYLPMGQVELSNSFGTLNSQDIWDILSSHLDIYKIEVDGVSRTFEYCWSDANYKQMQIDMMKPGYDYTSRTLKD